MRRGRFLDVKRRPLQNKEGVSLFLPLLLQLTRHCIVTPRPAVPLLASVRHSPPWEGLGEVLPFGEGTGVRLVVDGGEAGCCRV